MTNDRVQLMRGGFVAMLLFMTVRGADWLLASHSDATAASYALEVATAAICGATAWVTWHPPQRLDERLRRLAVGIRRR